MLVIMKVLLPHVKVCDAPHHKLKQKHSVGLPIGKELQTQVRKFTKDLHYALDVYIDTQMLLGALLWETTVQRQILLLLLLF